MGAENFPGTSGAVGAGKRSAKRNRVLLAAKLKTANGEVEARLRDLSQKGALVECADCLSVGDEVVFTRGTTIVPARVAWTGGGRVGLEFHRMIHENELLVQLGRPSNGQNQQRFRRPALNESLNPHERKLAQLWGQSVGIDVSEG